MEAIDYDVIRSAGRHLLIVLPSVMFGGVSILSF